MMVDIFAKFVSDALGLVGDRTIIWLGHKNETIQNLLGQVYGEVDKQYFFENNNIDIAGKNDQYFLINAFDVPTKQILDKLETLGYSKNDYLFIFHEPIVLTARSTPYKDEWGNEINYIPHNIQIVLEGFNNQISFGNNVVSNGGIFRVKNNSEIIIGDNVLCNLDITSIENFSKIYLGTNVRFVNRSSVTLYSKGKFVINDFSEFSGPNHFWVMNDFEIEIGKRCLFASNVWMRAGDGHAIFDIETKQRINSPNALGKEKRTIKIGDHVWVGARSAIFAGANIGDGSVIGACSVVKKKVPNNCVAVGNNLRIVRKNVAWTGNFNSENIADCGEYANLTIEEDVKIDK